MWHRGNGFLSFSPHTAAQLSLLNHNVLKIQWVGSCAQQHPWGILVRAMLKYTPYLLKALQLQARELWILPLKLFAAYQGNLGITCSWWVRSASGGWVVGAVAKNKTAITESTKLLLAIYHVLSVPGCSKNTRSLRLSEGFCSVVGCWSWRTFKVSCFQTSLEAFRFL